MGRPVRGDTTGYLEVALAICTTKVTSFQQLESPLALLQAITPGWAIIYHSITTPRHVT